MMYTGCCGIIGRDLLLGKMGKNHQRMVLTDGKKCSSGAEKGEDAVEIGRGNRAWKGTEEGRE